MHFKYLFVVWKKKTQVGRIRGLWGAGWRKLEEWLLGDEAKWIFNLSQKHDSLPA